MSILSLSLTKRYIPAVLLIAFFIIFTNIINSKSIIKNKEFGKIINISGKQRMLSQKLVILGLNYITIKSDNNKNNLLKTINEMKLNHQYLLTKVFTNNLHQLYFEKSLDTDLNNFLKKFENLIITNNKSYLSKARIQSSSILHNLDIAVKEYESYTALQLDKMSKYEFYLTLLTLFILIMEVLFIFKPAAKEIEYNSKNLKLLNENLEKTVKDQTKELQKNIDMVSKHVIYSKTDLKGTITEVSEAFCKISGYTNKELVGNKHNMIRHKDMSSEIFKNLWKTIKSGKIWHGEVKNLKKDGNYYWTSAIITPEYDNDIIIGYMAIRYDITSKKDFEKQSIQLIQSEKMASLGEMIGNIAHQWRQPLSSISSRITSMQMQKELGILEDDFFIQTCEDINKNAHYLSETIDTFRNFLMAKKEYKNIILQDEIQQALGIVNAVLNHNNIKLIDNIDYNDKINITMITGELPQVIINIINNAKDILIDKKIQDPIVELNLIKQNDKLIITIQDNAGGVPMDIINKIFEPYFTTKHQSQGTGLGLHMSYEIMTKSLNGNLYVKNIQDGAKFYIEISA